MADLVLDPEEIRSLAETLRDAPPEEILRTALERIPRLTLACSFGAEDMVILDLLMKIDPEASVFYLDTDLFFPETYALRDEAVRRYGIPTALLRLEFAATSDFSRDDGAQSIQ